VVRREIEWGNGYGCVGPGLNSNLRKKKKKEEYRAKACSGKHRGAKNK